MKLLNKSNLSNIVILLVFAALIFSPQAKGLVIQGLMQIGFFQPSVPEENIMVSNSNVTNSPILFTSESGTLLDLHSLKGKVVFINFWATWCPPCIAEMPSINQLSKQFKNNKNIVFLMVDVDANQKKSKAFMTKRGFDLEVFIPSSQIPNSFLGKSIPTTVLLNKKGEIAFRHEGGADYTDENFVKYLEKLAKE